MFRTPFVSSARARFAATAATVFALVALGGVTAAPAYAYGDLTLTVIDDSTGAPYGDAEFTLTPVGGGFDINTDTYPDGTRSIGTMTEGDYYFNPVDPAYVKANAIVTIFTGGNHVTVHVDKFTVSGYVPAGMGSGNTTAVIQQDDGAGGWITDSVTQTISEVDDSFSLRVPNGAGTYRIQFFPAESSEFFTSYSDPFVVDGTSAVTTLAAPVTFDEAGFISGSVIAYNLGAGLEGADVHASVGGADVATTTTDVNGDFRLKLPRVDQSYIVWVDHGNYDPQWYNYATQESYATAVTLDTSNDYSVAGVNYLLNLDTSDLHLSVVDGSGPYAVDVTLFKYDDHALNWSSFPTYLSYQPEDSLDFTNLAEGQYRLVLQHPTTGVVLPANGQCFTEFSSVLVTDVNLTDLLVDPATTADVCDEPAFYDPLTDQTVTGTVSNIADLDYAVTAQLWSTGPYGALYPVDSSIVDPTTGDYELTGLRDSWNYTIKFIVDDRDPYLDALLGSDGQTWPFDSSVDEDVIANHPLALEPSDPSTLINHDVTLEPAAIIPGSAFSGSAPVVGTVTALSPDFPWISFAKQLDADGSFLFKLPFDNDYTLLVEADDDEYIAEYWQDAAFLSDAEVISTPTPGSYGPFNFELEPTPAQLYVWVSDAQLSDEIIVHLYFSDEGVWRELESQETSFEEAYFNQNYFSGLYDGLEPGDYRVRFETTGGVWLQSTVFNYGQDATEGYYVDSTAPSCFVDFPALTPGFASYVYAEFDVTNQDPSACAAEPLPDGDVSGHFEGSSFYGSEDVASHQVELYKDDYSIFATTDADGDFEMNDVPNGTYSVYLEPQGHTPGTHDYTYYGPDVVLTGGDIDLGTLTATRYGNAHGTISNWDDAEMSGATATVMQLVSDPAGDYWQPGPLDVEISSTGEFEAPGIDLNGSYGVFIQFPHTWAPVYIGGGLLAPDSPFTGTAEEDYDLGSVSVTLDEYVTITGTAFFGSTPAANTWVYATPVDGCTCQFYETFVDEDGNYSLEVAPNLSYEVVAFSAITQVQFYDGYNYPLGSMGPFDSTPVSVGTTGATGIDFALIANDDLTLSVTPDSWDEATDSYDSIYDVEVHLYEKVNEGWVEIGSELANPWSIFVAGGDTEYRVRFSQNGDWLAIHDADWGALYPFSEPTITEDVLDPAQCYYDFGELAKGIYVESLVGLIEDSSSYGCGPETQLPYDVVGSTVKTANAGGGVIEGQTVTLTSQTAPYTVYTTTTDASGGFIFEDIVAGDYTFEAVSLPAASGGNVYVGYGFTTTVDGDEDLGPIELTRWGNAEVQITNYNDLTMSGTTAQVYELVSGDWEPRGFAATVDSTGFVSAPGIAADGTYTVYLDYPTGFVDGYLSTLIEGEVISAAGYAEYDLTGLDTLAYTTISGTVRQGSTALLGATVEAENSWGDLYTTTTAANGTYSIAVPAGYTYTVEARKSGLVRDIDTALAVDFTPVTGEDFSLAFATFFTSVWTGPMTQSNTTTVHLYRQVTGGWQEVDSDTWSDTLLATSLAGSYRIRVSDGADWLAITDYEWLNATTPSQSSGGTVSPTPDVCFVSFGAAIAGSEYETDLAVDAASSVECAAEPAVVVPTSPPVPPGTSKGKSPAATDEEVVTEELEPTSTPTPSPEPSDDATDEPTDETVVDKPEAASTPDLTWLFWLSGIVVLILLGGGAVYFIRRR